MRVTLFRNPSLKCRLQGIILFRSPPIRRPSLRNESDSELIVMLDGVYTAREIHAEQKVFVRAEAGDAVFWPGHVRRIEENDPDKPFRCFAIFLRWPSAPLDLPRVVPDTDGIMRYLAMQLIAIKESRTPLPSAVANGFLSALLAEYLRRALSPPDPLEAKVLAFLSRHRTTPFTLDALAHFVGLQRHHFGRVFKKRTGFSPMDYVRRKRLEWARALIRDIPSLPLSEVAARVGIPSDAELRRQLQRYTGMGIRALRKTFRVPGGLPSLFQPPND